MGESATGRGARPIFRLAALHRKAAPLRYAILLRLGTTPSPPWLGGSLLDHSSPCSAFRPGAYNPCTPVKPIGFTLAIAGYYSSCSTAALVHWTNGPSHLARRKI